MLNKDNLFNYVRNTLERYAQDQTIFIKASQFINSYGSDELVIKNGETVNRYLNTMLHFGFWGIYAMPGAFIRQSDDFGNTQRNYIKTDEENAYYWNSKKVIKKDCEALNESLPEEAFEDIEEFYPLHILDSFIAELRAFVATYYDLASKYISCELNPNALFKISYVNTPPTSCTFHRCDGKSISFELSDKFERSDIIRMLTEAIETIKDDSDVG